MSIANFLEINFKNDAERAGVQHNTRILPFKNSALYDAPIIKATHLTKGDDVKTVIDLALSVENVTYDYEPGDTIGILPYNDETEVKLIIERLNLVSVADIPYTLSIIPNVTKKSVVIPKHLPHNGTIRQVFTEYIDIRSPPKKLFLKMLSGYSSEEDREKLNFLCSSSGSSEYNKLIASRGKILLNILNSFPTCNPPIEKLLESLPPLQPRAYSIASSPLLHNVLHLAFSVIIHEDGTKGICSGFLENKALLCMEQPSKFPKVQFYFRKPNDFKLPINPTTPIIMIGPGTGVTPFVGFLQHRMLQKQTYGTSWLFYGCRFSKKDFLYENEIRKFEEDGVLTKLFVSFSREGNYKDYVQHNIKKNAKEFADLMLEHNAVVFVCGDAKNMAGDVKREIMSSLCKHGVGEESIDDFMLQLQKDKRYITDIWL